MTPIAGADGEKRVDYLVLSSTETGKDAEWREVIATLEKKHENSGQLLFEKGDLSAVLPALQELHPRYVCVVAQHPEVTREFVSQLHQVTRQIDDDPYADVRWGILTGYDAANALAIAKTSKPLVVQRVASGTEVALDKCQEGIWYCELKKNRMVKKEKGGQPVEAKGPDDTTRVIAETLNDYKADLFVTSGHATERDWQIGFRYKNGYFKCKAGQLYGLNTKGEKIDINSPNPKVYMPIGNCLMGHIDGSDAMALAWLNSAGVHQMLGYTVPTWYGYAGWGCLDYFIEQPGRYSFSEAFFANQHAMIHRLDSCFPEFAKMPLKDPNEATKRGRRISATPLAKELKLSGQDAVGLLFDRDALVFYGDPAWEARMADGALAYGQKLSEKDGVMTFEVTPNTGADSFKPVNTNGSQRGWRPMVHFFPERIDPSKIEILEGKELKPVIADDFILVPNPRKVEEGRSYRVRFRVGEAAS